MLAPRKKLWSSPSEVVDAAIQLLNLAEGDICCDIGCGDGRFLLQACNKSPITNLIGIEIDEVRFTALQQNVNRDSDLVSRIKLICGNALEQDFSTVTCFFLYLIPHGLRVIYKHVLSKILGRRIRVVTYMSPLPPEFAEPVQVVKVPTAGHTDAEWPLYYYELYNTESYLPDADDSTESTPNDILEVS